MTIKGIPYSACVPSEQPAQKKKETLARRLIPKSSAQALRRSTSGTYEAARQKTAATPAVLQCSVASGLANIERALEIVTKQHYNRQHKKTKRANREAVSNLFSTSFVTKQNYN